MENKMPARNFHIRGLGELAIRCNDLPKMVEFYRDIIGLELLSGQDFEDIVFFRIADGVEGHTTVLALFRHSSSNPMEAVATGPTSSLHHFALSLPFAEQENVITWYQEKEIEFEVRNFDWIGWRGVFTTDPEGNSVEIVAKIPTDLHNGHGLII